MLVMGMSWGQWFDRDREFFFLFLKWEVLVIPRSLHLSKFTKLFLKRSRSVY